MSLRTLADSGGIGEWTPPAASEGRKEVDRLGSSLWTAFRERHTRSRAERAPPRPEEIQPRRELLEPVSDPC